MYIPIILGTAREGRRSEHAARFVLEEAKKKGIETELVDVRDYLIGHTENPAREAVAERYRAIVTRADGLIIVTPEYNHGYPGELKLLLDEAYDEYARKPLGICGTGGGFGGVRAIEQLRMVAFELKMVPIPEAVYFSHMKKGLFNETGVITDPAYGARVGAFLDELVWYAEALAVKRKNTPQ